LPYLQPQTLNGTFEPFRIYLTCYQVLRANHDVRAQTILAAAHRLLLERAAQIEDRAARQKFLEEVKVNRALMDAWEPSEAVEI